MNSVTSLPDSRTAVMLVVAWLCCSFSGAFAFWSIGSPVGLLQDPGNGIARYLYGLQLSLVAGAILVAVLRFAGLQRFLSRLALYGTLIYFGAAKTLGWYFAPWLAIGAALFGMFIHRGGDPEIRGSLLLLHVMGSLSGLYFVVQAGGLLGSYAQFGEVLRSLWLLVFG